MKIGGGHFAPKLGGQFELESGGHFKLELGGQYHWNLQFVLNFRNIMFNSFKSSLNKFDSPPFCSTKNPVKIDFTGFFISNN